jgi:hypothetical protein
MSYARVAAAKSTNSAAGADVLIAQFFQSRKIFKTFYGCGFSEKCLFLGTLIIFRSPPGGGGFLLCFVGQATSLCLCLSSGSLRRNVYSRH